jgi:hypothetical protein
MRVRSSSGTEFDMGGSVRWQMWQASALMLVVCSTSSGLLEYLISPLVVDADVLDFRLSADVVDDLVDFVRELSIMA